MSWYTSTALTVEKDKTRTMIAWIKENEVTPDQAFRHRDGSCTFLWMDRNHFDPERKMAYFLEDVIGEDSYSMEVVDEEFDTEWYGNGSPSFDAYMTFNVWGDNEDISKEVE